MIGSDTVKNMLSYLNEEVIEELKEAYSDVSYGSRINLRTVMSKIYAKIGRQFVIVIDEWDCIFREFDDPGVLEQQKIYLDFLRDWLKDKEYVALVQRILIN